MNEKPQKLQATASSNMSNVRAGDGSIPKICIDTQESESTYVHILRLDDLFDIAVKRLEVGDILIDDLIIERKTSPDFWRSLEDGRLFRQLLLMKRLHRRRMLLIEGTIVPQTDREKASFEGVITRVSSTLQVPILFSLSGADTARLIRRMSLQLFGFTTPQVTRCIGSNRAQSFYEINVLVGIPGVGYARSKGLIAHFGSLQKVFAASAEQLVKAPGIGEYLAKELEALFRRG